MYIPCVFQEDMLQVCVLNSILTIKYNEHIMILYFQTYIYKK